MSVPGESGSESSIAAQTLLAIADEKIKGRPGLGDDVVDSLYKRLRESPDPKERSWGEKLSEEMQRRRERAASMAFGPTTIGMYSKDPEPEDSFKFQWPSSLYETSASDTPSIDTSDNSPIDAGGGDFGGGGSSGDYSNGGSISSE